MVNMYKYRYLRIFTLGLHRLINRTFHPVAVPLDGLWSVSVAFPGPTNLILNNREEKVCAFSITLP